MKNLLDEVITMVEKDSKSRTVRISSQLDEAIRDLQNNYGNISYVQASKIIAKLYSLKSLRGKL